ncbi:MAG: serine/threonine protein kinase [Lentisphaeraceae bacterium]|nr:serine/threonine protein kinase [Lentisphaeraceae bacterium]
MSKPDNITKTIVYKPQGFQPSTHESKFVIEGTLGQGGMGTIYDAFDRNVRRKVAIKSINSEIAQNVVSRKYFTKEAQITGQLEHPNIIPVYEMGVNPQDRLYYVMKRVQGITLADVLDGIKDGQRRMIRQYPLPVLLSIYQKVLDAIAYAHARGVVHLDLKPENIMVGEFGEVLVLDWGIARLRKRSPNVDQTRFVTLDDSVNLGEDFENEQVIGTPAFMAPEQASGKSKTIGTRTDIYALGAILYNILTLRPPAAGRTTTVVLKKIVTGRVIDPLSYNEPNNKQQENIIHLRHLPDEKVPEALSKVCMKAMNERLDGRYQAVRDLQEDLYAYFSGYATTAEDAGLSRRLSLYISRNKYLIITVILLVIINIIILLIAVIK